MTSFKLVRSWFWFLNSYIVILSGSREAFFLHQIIKKLLIFVITLDILFILLVISVFLSLKWGLYNLVIFDFISISKLTHFRM